MALYYFDIDDGASATVDTDGAEFASLGELRAAAIGVLPAIARDELSDGDRRVFSVTVRDASGARLFRATLSFAADWLETPGADALPPGVEP